MIDPNIIDAKLVEARQRDQACTTALLSEVARLPVVGRLGHPYTGDGKVADIIVPGRSRHSGTPHHEERPLPDSGSYAYQLYSAICFMVDARVELKLLEFCSSPDFYAALMRSAAEVNEP